MDTTFAAVISQLRKEQGVSQKQAAQDLGISQALLSHYEKGIRECGLGFVVKAAAYYDVTSDYLLGLSKSKLSPLSEEERQKEAFEETEMMQAAGTLLYLSHKNKNGAWAEQGDLYYMLCIYRAALTAGQNGLLPREMFHLDFSLGRALATAAIALEDAQATASKSRSHPTQKSNSPLDRLIETAEGYLTACFPLQNPELAQDR